MQTSSEPYDKINDYSSVRISLARPQDIRSWSFGEVKKPETINYRTFRPERDGLFCEKIFGPEKDYECSCGKYRGVKYKGMTCDRCGVKLDHSKIRRKRMGHIDLVSPVVHIWFFKAASSRLATLLGVKASSLEKIIYYQDYVVIDPADTTLKVNDLLTEKEFRDAHIDFPGSHFKAEMGADAIRKLLQRLNLTQESTNLRQEMTETKSKQRKKDIINRLKLIEALMQSENRPEWMVLDAIPVIPPDLRPLVHLDSGSFATSDLNDLYRRIINRNNRLKKLIDLNAPEVIVRNEKRMLQQAVDSLFDNGRCKRPTLGSSSRPLKSLTDMIKGKQGRFRENLLGKRVDYSARSVIVVGPNLRLHQCGLPKKIALELFQPFIIRRLKELQHADTIKSAKKMLERKDEEVWDILEEVIRNHPVLLNRAPTLHRMGIQAFEPILVEGNAIKLHPLVCRGFNADFDGDQMAVHLPLSLEAQVEAHTLMLSTNNIFSPANGAPIISPSQDIVMGCYYMTMMIPGMKGEGMTFASREELLFAHAQGIVDLHAKIKVRMPKGRWDNEHPEITEYKLFETTAGRILFNDILPPGMPYYNETLKSKGLSQVISDCHRYSGRRATIDLLDNLMRTGFKESTKSGLSFATDDLITPEGKKTILNDAELEVKKIRDMFNYGVISEDERYNRILDTWTEAEKKVSGAMMQEFNSDTKRWLGYVNPVGLMATSGARGGETQIRQLAGMRGLMTKPNGKVIETPIKANFREGLTVLEYFSSTHGARKGLSDTALKTSESGYLTRKLADVAQNVVVTCHDCGTTQGITKGIVYQGEQVEVSLADSIKGRVSRMSIIHPITDEVIVRENELITVEIAKKIEELSLEKIQIRSPMTCEAEVGICANCYGMDLSTGRLVEQGMAVGIIAAESIGEPGTQLTMRTFHTGGTATLAVAARDIRSKYAGTAKYVNIEAIESEKKSISLTRKGAIAILDPKGREIDKYDIPSGAELLVKDGHPVAVGEALCQWDPHSVPIHAKASGYVHYVDIIDGDTVRTEVDSISGKTRRTVTDVKGDRHPQIDLKSADGKETLEIIYLPVKATLEVEDGAKIERGVLLAKTARDVGGTQDIAGEGGLPRVTEVFEARKPKEPAVVAEIGGSVSLGEKRHNKRTIVIQDEETGIERIHEVTQGKHLRVQTGDSVNAGYPLTDGSLVPHDILRINGEEAVQEYLVREIQKVYRKQKVTINDKHIEVIISQMLRKVMIESAGDTKLLEGSQVDKFMFRHINSEIATCVKVDNPGDTNFGEGDIVPRATFDDLNSEFVANGGKAATCKQTVLARATTQLLGITKAAVQSPSFISAASFQETTKVLTEAALAGKKDRLIGLKENVILGHLIPAGTGFASYQNAQWRPSQEAAEALSQREAVQIESAHRLLEDIPQPPIDLLGEDPKSEPEPEPKSEE
ncbi:MAG: DNA-directed RNA polymerase subunit beta' [Planctomycetaceae bacterium]|nr:DNA-directed RNA polymerase subunit beta' [Planctomycetaceae bacterium]